MRHLRLLLLLVGLLSCFSARTAIADAISSDPEDPSNAVRLTRERNAQKDSLLGVSPRKCPHESIVRANDQLYKKIHLRINFAFNHVFQGLTRVNPGTDRWGTAPNMDVYGTWEVVHRG